MSMIDRSLDGMAALSGHLGAVLRRRLRELGGIALISLTMMGGLALATWSVQDPSLSHATAAPVHNLLGMPGAIAADLLMQLLGLGSLALLLPIAVWGYRLLGHRRLSHERLRVLLWLVGAALTAGFASCLPKSPHWPLPSGLGGVIGDAVLQLPVLLLHTPLAGWSRFAAAIVLGIAALVAFAGAAGMLWRDAADDDEDEEISEDDDERGWISLGFLAHSFLSFRARLARLFGRRSRTPIPSPGDDAMPRQRIEPRFGGAADPYADEELDETPTPRLVCASRARRKRRAGPAAAMSCPRSNCSPRRAKSAAPPSAPKSSRKTPPRSKACLPISACAARSSMRARVRW